VRLLFSEVATRARPDDNDAEHGKVILILFCHAARFKGN